MTIWRPGMKAVCVRDDWPPETREIKGFETPQSSRVYTVSSVRFSEVFDTGVGLVLDGLRIPYGAIVSWDAFAFRPVQERKTDISIFTRMLTPKTAKEDA